MVQSKQISSLIEALPPYKKKLNSRKHRYDGFVFNGWYAMFHELYQMCGLVLLSAKFSEGENRQVVSDLYSGVLGSAGN